MGGVKQRELVVVADPAALAKAAADRVMARIDANQARIAICLTGGSSPKQLYALLASDAYRGRIPWDRVHWFIGDERFLPPSELPHHIALPPKIVLAALPPPPTIP